MGNGTAKMDTFTKEYPLTSYQKDIWMQQKIHSEMPFYNIGGYIEVNGEVDYDMLSEALNIVVNEDDILRIIMGEREGEPFYKFLPRMNYKIEYHDFAVYKDSREYSIEWQKKEFTKAFNIYEGMFKVVLIKIAEERNHILLKFHHLIIDQLDISLLYKRLVDIYNSLIPTGMEVELVRWLPISDLQHIEKIDSQEEITGEVPLTPIQKTFFSWKLFKPNQFNQSIMIMAKEGFSEKAIKETLTAIVKHHDILRAVFKSGNQEILSINNSKLFQFKKYDLRDLSNSDIEETVRYENNKLQSTFDLSNGPLVKAALYQTVDGDHLIVCIHHLVVDSFSWRILIEDFQTGYNQYIDNEEISLPKKLTSYKEWANELSEYSQSEKILKEIEYWEKINKDLIYGKIANNSSGKEYGYGKFTFHFDLEKTSKLLHEVGKIYDTEINDVLLGSLVMAYKLWRGKKKLVLKLEDHGRERISEKIQIDRTVGWFTSIFPIVLEATDSLEKSIVNTKEMLRNIPEHGIGYNVIKQSGIYEMPEMEVDISFNYLGEFKIRDDVKGKFENSYLSRGNDISKDNVFSNIIFNGSVIDGEFNMEVWYNKNNYSQRAIEELVKCYEGMLNQVIENFMSAKGKNRNDIKKEKNEIEIFIREILPVKQYDISNFVNTKLFKELTFYDDKNRDSQPEAFETFKHEKFFMLEIVEEICCERVEILGTICQKDIITIIRETVKEQGVFRISHDKDNKRVYQHKYKENWYLPYIDISNNDNIKEKFEILESVLNIPELFEDNRLLAKIVIVKVALDKHYIYFYVQAALRDEISIEILGESIKVKCFLH
ncbi:condensation domain-containing protein [Clostridium cellulovorans]|uniref:Phenylalanine racemase (ATP-hydrolyzing) n=1 Tax=Clostridium cellulovorans (strain ATCC 35296 / DSM 3052 / OCM 3 / 743B) TaxID=573061 RepID=D9STR5_CLOC7|nr:condensation domain-containing protein [Clostridium cellulovorans]ADL52799.1 Phenylalanine racemase (ATP-hydrolyzing) [Clostridium cellulovorans 743B]